MSGSPWVTQSQVRMGGDTSDEHVTLSTFDNFHRVYTTEPHHIPQLNNTCPESGQHPCEIKGLTVTENYYDNKTIADTGFTPNAALEQKAKLMSRQDVQWHAGHVNASFDKLDQNDYACQKLN